MMRIHPLRAGAAFLAVATLAALYWMAPAGDADVQTAVAPAVAPPAAAPPATLRAPHRGSSDPSAPPGGNAPLKEAPAVRWRALQARFAHATSLRAFYYEALRSPQDGGYHYATSALGACRGPKPPEDEVPPRRRQALEALQGRCDFSAQELEDAWGQFGAIRNLRYDDDPLLRNIFDYLAARDPAAQRQAIVTAIDTGEPYVIASIVTPSLAPRLAPALKEEGVAWAQMLIACRLGADCGPESVAMLGLCAHYGWCADDVDAALRAGLGADFALLDRLSAQAVTDIRKRNIDALLRPR